MDRAIISAHEAGHGVVGIVLGCRLLSISLEPPVTTFARLPRASAGVWCLRALAGGLAERLLADGVSGAAADLEDVCQRLGPAFSSFVDQLVGSAAALVEENAETIMRVACALLDAGTLSGPEVTGIIAAA